MAVFMPDPEQHHFWDLARDQYGSQTPMTPHTSVRGVISAVQSGEAAIGIMPVPYYSVEDPWWRHIYSEAENTPQILSRLPFAQTETVRGTFEEALIIGLPSDDHTKLEKYYTALEFDGQISPRQILGVLEKSNLNATVQGQWHDEAVRDQWLFLVEADEVITPDHLELDKLDVALTHVKKMGGYAIPFTVEELS